MNAVTQESAQLISREGVAATLKSVQIEGQLDGPLLRLADQIPLSRQSERLLLQVLKDEDAKILQELKLTWAVRIDAFMNHELVSEGSTADGGEFEIPEFLRKQAD